MYCKLKGYKAGGLVNNPDHVKVLAILKSHQNGEPRTVVIEANWAACTNPMKKYKDKMLYHDPSLKNETGNALPNAYYLSYREVEIIDEYDNNRKASVILEEEY